MRLTTKGRFAVTAMVDLTLHKNTGAVSLAAISKRQQISLSYLEQLFGKLRRHKLVESIRGPGGGYTLGRMANEISIADVIISVDEPLDATLCAGKGNCHSGGPCMTHDLWTALNQKMIEFLDSVTLENMANEQIARGFRVEASKSVRKIINANQIVKPIHINAPNSVFALGTMLNNEFLP